MDEASDPKIVDRLSKLPPFVDDSGQVVGTPVEEPQEPQEPQESQEPQEDVEDEQLVDTSKTAEEVNQEQIKNEVTEEVTEEEALANSKQPERTKKYIEKLKKQNEEIKRGSILESLNPEPPEFVEDQNNGKITPTTNVIPNASQFSGVSQQEINNAFKEIMDENGFVDRGLLNSTIGGLIEKNQKMALELEEQKKENKKTVRMVDDFQREQVMKQIHEKYPKLNPENTGEGVPEDKRFDDRLWQYVHKEMVSHWVREAESGKVVNPNDKNEQAKLVESLTQKGMDLLSEDLLNDEGEVDPSRLMNKKDKAKAEEALNAKINIGAIGSKQTSQRSWDDHDTLVKATMRGDKGALAERLRRAGQ